MYTIKQAAQRVGISVPVMRAWERRYGIVSPERTPAGYRLYDDDAIDRLATMRRLVESGWSASQAAAAIRSGEVPVDASAAALGATPSDPSSRADLIAPFVASAAAMDEPAVEALLDEAFARGTFERVVDEHLLPALRALGDAWAAGSVSVAAEHAASHAVLRRLAAAFQAAAHPTDRPAVLVGLPAGSRHEAAALAFATALRRRGIPAIYLGADVPASGWLAAVTATGARAVVIGAPTASDAAAAVDTAATLRVRHPSILLAFGGAVDTLPDEYLRLPEGIAQAAATLDRALTPS
jgi:DNA-binding transcriptional MerR regulator/methylmalonyl-CoA mutase cobalamin-binding subunit